MTEASEPADDDRTIFQPSESKGRDDLPSVPGVRLHREIARGGMGVVYQGNQDYLDREVAVKVLSTQLSGPEFSKRFQREAKILAGIKHPNIVGCHTAGQNEDGLAYLVMEFIDGPNLKGWLTENGALEVATSLRLTRALAAALHHANEQGVIHRDVKAENVLLENTTSTTIDPRFPYAPKLVDLGLARMAQPTGAMDMDLTSPGAVMGTPSTMSPEQFDDPDSVDFRADIYGLGCVLFRCVTGGAAFQSKSLVDVISAKRAAAGPDPRSLRPEIPAAVAELVGKMTAGSRDDRPASYQELISALDQLLTVKPGPRDAGVPGALSGKEEINLLNTQELGHLMEDTPQPGRGTGVGGFPEPTGVTAATGVGSREPTKTPSVAPTVVDDAKANRPLVLVAVLLVVVGVGIGLWQPWSGTDGAEGGGGAKDSGTGGPGASTAVAGETSGGSPADVANTHGKPSTGGAAAPPSNRAPAVSILGNAMLDPLRTEEMVASIRDADGDTTSVRWRHLDGARVEIESPQTAITKVRLVEGVPDMTGRIAVTVDDGHGHPVEAVHKFRVGPYDPVWFLKDDFKSGDSPWTIDGGRWGWNGLNGYHFCVSNDDAECARTMPKKVWRVAMSFEPSQQNTQAFSTCGFRVTAGGKTHGVKCTRTGSDGGNWRLEVVAAVPVGEAWEERSLPTPKVLEWTGGKRPEVFVTLTSEDLQVLVTLEGAEAAGLEATVPMVADGQLARFTFFSRGGRSIFHQSGVW